MEYAPKAFDDELNEPGTDFDIDIGSIHTNILTRVNEALSQTGGLGEGGDKDKCFVQQMIHAIVTSVAMAVGEVMKSFLKKMPKPADTVSVDRSPVVQNLQRNLLLMRYENDRLEQYSRRETIKVVGLKEEEGEDTEQKVLGIFTAVGADITPADVSVVHRTGDRKRKGRPILVRFVSRKKRKGRPILVRFVSRKKRKGRPILVRFVSRKKRKGRPILVRFVSRKKRKGRPILVRFVFRKKRKGRPILVRFVSRKKRKGRPILVRFVSRKKRKGRPILVRFVSRKKRKKVMQKKKVLKDKREYTGVYVFDDLTTLRAKMLYYLKKKVPVVENAWTIDGRIHCTKKRPPGLSERESPRRIFTIDTPDDLLVSMLLTLRSSALQTCFVSRNPMGV